MKRKKKMIGRVDRIDFPDFHLFDIGCKIDTGAKTSSIHCQTIKHVESESGDKLKVWFLDPQHILYNDSFVLFDEFSERAVKASTGISQKRYVVRTSVILFGTIHQIDLTLADRETMKYPVLLGRSFLSHKFVVDVSKSNLSHKQKCKQLLQSAKEESDEDRNTLQG